MLHFKCSDSISPKYLSSVWTTTCTRCSFIRITLTFLLVTSLLASSLIIVTAGSCAGAENLQMDKSLVPADSAEDPVEAYEALDKLFKSLVPADSAEDPGELTEQLHDTLVSPARSLLTMPPSHYDARNVLPTLLPLSKDLPAFGVSRGSGSLTVLSSQDKDQTVWSFRMALPSMLGRLQADAEFAFRPFEPFVTSEFGNRQSDAYRFEIRGGEKEFTYGVNYVAVRKAFSSLLSTKKRLDVDREGPKVWASWSRGRVGLSVFIRSLHDNLDADVNKPRFTTTDAGASFTYMLSTWPYLGYTVSYSEGEKKSSREPKGYTPYRGPVSTLEHSLSYSSQWVDIALYSSYSREKDLLQPVERNADMRLYYLSTTLKPIKALRITPEISYGIDRYADSAASTHRRSASLSVDYWPTRNIGYRAFGSYYVEKNRQWRMDTRYLYTELAVVRALRLSARGGETLSFSVGHQRYLEAASPGNNIDEFTLWLMLKIPLFRSGTARLGTDS